MALVTLKKELAVVEDMDFGLGQGTGTRGGTQINASHIPYSSANSIADELDTKGSVVDNDAKYASKAGDGVAFSVASAGNDGQATNLGQVNQILTAYPLTTQVVGALETKANKAGDTSVAFSVFNVDFNTGGPFPAPTDAVNFKYMEEWFTGVVQPAINAKAEKSEIISKTDIPDTPYVPTDGQHPANKKYVDDKVLDIGAGDMTKSEFVNPDTATTGVHTANNVGSFGSTNGLANADTAVMKLSQHVMTDADAIISLGIGIFIGVDVQNSPPASAGVPIAIEQMDMDGTGRLIGQRCTTDIGVFTRFGYDSSVYNFGDNVAPNAMVWTPWAHTLLETDYASTYAGGTVKMTVSGTSCAITNDGSDAILP